MFDDPSLRRVVLALSGAAVLLVALLIRPFWQALLVAAVLAAVLRPAMEWLAARIRRRRHIAAALITFALLLVVAVPLAILSRTAGFELRWAWYLSVASVTLQMLMSLFLLRREFRRKLEVAPMPAPAATSRRAMSSRWPA